MRYNIPESDMLGEMLNKMFAELYGGIMTSGETYHVSLDGDDVDGLSWEHAFTTIQAAIDASGDYTGDRILIGEGDYDETVTISRAHEGLILQGVGPRGSVCIAPSTSGAEGCMVHANDTTFINIGVAGETAADYALKFTGARFRAFGCKLEGADTAGATVIGVPCTVAQRAAGTDGNAADFLFEDCEFAWAKVGFSARSSDYGSLTQGKIKNSRFHNCVTACIGEIDSGALGSVRDFLVEGNTFENQEDGTAPTDFVHVDSVGCTGLFTGNRFAVATNDATVLMVAAGILWVANETEAGISTARPA